MTEPSWGVVPVREACAPAVDTRQNQMIINDLEKGKPPAPWLSELQPDSAGYLGLSNEAVAKYFAQDLSPQDLQVVAATQEAA